MTLLVKRLYTHNIEEVLLLVLRYSRITKLQ